MRERALDAEFEFVEREWFVDVVVGAALHGFDGDLERTGRQDHHHQSGRVERTRLLQECVARRAGSIQGQMREDQVRRNTAQSVARQRWDW